MINTIQLMVNPIPVWKRLASQNSNGYVAILVSLLPLMIVSCGVEAWFLIHQGTPISGLESISKITPELGQRYATSFVLFSLLGTFLAAFLIRQICLGTQVRHTFNQCLLLTVYCTTPAFIVRFADAWNVLSTWVVLAVAVFFIFSAAYSGVPNLIKPDPAKAFGLFFTCGVLISFCHAGAHALSYLVLQERILAGGLGLGILGF